MKTQYLFFSTLMLILQASCKKDSREAASYTIDEDASKIEWKGSAPDHFHTGAFSVKGYFKTDKNGQITGGDFIIPITSIRNYDLPDDQKELLLADLKGTNFFNVAVHPKAEFHITSVTAYKGGDATVVEGANYLITGDFSMIGQSHPLSFPVRIKKDDRNLQTSAIFKLNRLQWGMKSYNDPTKPLYLLPEVEITLNIESEKQ